MIHSNSRYINSQTFKDSNGTIILVHRKRQHFNLSSSTLYTFKAGDTLDAIAYKCYGYTSYYWAILDCNTQYTSEADVKVGDTLYIPSKQEVLKFYGQL